MTSDHITIPGYQVMQQVGKGGMAIVYLAIQESLGREVIIKVLNLTKKNQTNFVKLIKRFTAEGKLVASLQHPNIVTVYDVGVSEGRHFYIAMEYVEGGDLKQRIASGISIEKSLDTVIKIGRALDFAHQAGIIHRDVKPGNILFRKDGTPLLTDFGIAKRSTTDQKRDMTSTGTLLGSPNYISPEQINNLPVDGRADIYSLGCTLYEMLTGEIPYQAKVLVDLLLQHRTAAIPKLPNELQDLQPLIERMLAKKREMRFSSASLMVAHAEVVYKQWREKQKTQSKTVSSKRQHLSSAPTEKKTFKLYLRQVLLFIVFALVTGIVFLFHAINQVEKPDVKHAVLQEDNTFLITSDTHFSSETESLQREHENSVTAVNGSEELIRALLWLARYSTQELRLTHPPKDNAYYYYKKILSIQSDNEEANQGLHNIAARYAEAANYVINKENDLEKALKYVNLGLKVEPENTKLQDLQQLVSNLIQQKNQN